jgi:hypothetical protein
VARHPEDRERIARGRELLDDLHRSLRPAGTARPALPPRDAARLKRLRPPRCQRLAAGPVSNEVRARPRLIQRSWAHFQPEEKWAHPTRSPRIQPSSAAQSTIARAVSSP